MARTNKKFSIRLKRGEKIHYGLYPTSKGERPVERKLIKDVELKQQAATKAERNALLDRLYLQNTPTTAPRPIANKIADKFAAEVVAFLDFIATEKSQKTYSEYKRVLVQLTSLDDVDELRSRWLARGLSPHTVNKNIRTITRFERWRVTRENNKRVSQGLPALPARRWERVNATDRKIRKYSDDQLDAILSYIDEKAANPPQTISPYFQKRWKLLRRAFLLLRYTGCRGSEVNALRWSDIDDKSDTRFVFIDFEDHKTASGADYDVKGDHEEKVPIVFKSFADEIKTWDRTHKYVLEGYWNTAVELNRAFKRIQQELGIDGIKPLHGFRAAYCTKLITLGLNPALVQQAARHRDISTTIRYVNATKNELAESALALTAGL